MINCFSTFLRPPLETSFLEVSLEDGDSRLIFHADLSSDISFHELVLAFQSREKGIYSSTGRTGQAIRIGFKPEERMKFSGSPQSTRPELAPPTSLGLRKNSL